MPGVFNTMGGTIFVQKDFLLSENQEKKEEYFLQLQNLVIAIQSSSTDILWIGDSQETEAVIIAVAYIMLD